LFGSDRCYGNQACLIIGGIGVVLVAEESQGRQGGPLREGPEKASGDQRRVYVHLVGRSSCNLETMPCRSPCPALEQGGRHGKVRVAPQAASPLPWRARQPSAWLAKMNPWQTLPVSFPGRCSHHPPAPVGSWLLTPCPGTCPSRECARRPPPCSRALPLHEQLAGASWLCACCGLDTIPAVLSAF
jgi:hypothetical protein